MKNLTIILTFVVSVCFGQTNEPLDGKPKTLKGTFPYLDQKFDDTTMYNLTILPEDVVTRRLNFPFGMWIRNDWGLRKNSELKNYFNSQGVYNPEIMTSIIFTSYHRYLNNDSIDFQGQIDRFNRINSNKVIDTLENGGIQVSFPELAKEKRTRNAELFEYYPIGDTVLVSLKGTKGLFRKTVHFKSLAETKGYTDDKLILKLGQLMKEDRVKTEYQSGKEIRAWAETCSLIPQKIGKY